MFVMYYREGTFLCYCRGFCKSDFINGSDHGVVASYLELYEEGEVEHINGVWPVFLFERFFTLQVLDKIPQSNPHLGLLISCPTVSQ